jgi:hypothetical protein
MGHPGHAISLATPDQAGHVRDIEKLIRGALKISTHPNVPAERFSAERKGAAPSRYQNRNGQQKPPRSFGSHGQGQGQRHGRGYQGGHRHFRGR